jgi:hypothetical protein
MLLRRGEISTGIRLNGEKWGFSGGMGAVDGCKLLKGMRYMRFEKHGRRAAHARQTCCLTVIVKLPRLAPWKSVSSPKKRRSWRKSLNNEVSSPPTWRNKSLAVT